MRANKTIAALSVACLSLAFAASVVAQDQDDTGNQAKPAAKAESVQQADAEEQKDNAKPADAKKEKQADAGTDQEVNIGMLENPDDAQLLSDLVTVENLRRESLDIQAKREMEAGLDAMNKRDWEKMFKQYRLAHSHLNDIDQRKECLSKMAEAKYQAAKQALRESDRENGIKLAEEARKLHHPSAAALLEALKAETSTENETDRADTEHERNKPEYKKDRDEVIARLRRSSQFLALSDLASALDQCDLVLRKDPYNQQAIALRERIQRKRQIIIEKERVAARNGMIADVDAAWRPVYAINSPELKAIEGGTTKAKVGMNDERSLEQSIEKRMKDMQLPAISFRPPATIIDAVDFFRQASKDFDRPEVPVDQRGFNFVLQLEKTLTGGDGKGDAKGNQDAFAAASDSEDAGAAGDVPQIPNISASNISLWEALKLVCKVSGFKFKVQGSVVMVMPKSMTTDELVTRTYSVVESFVDRMNEASSGLKNEKAGDFGGGGGGDDAGGGDGDEESWKKYFEEMGVTWPQNSRIKYIKAVGKLRVTNTEDQLAVLEDALTELNVTPSMIEIETRFVEVAQEDLNSLGFEWLLNSDYSFNVGGKIKKALNLKDGSAADTSRWVMVNGQRQDTTDATFGTTSTQTLTEGNTYGLNNSENSTSGLNNTENTTSGRNTTANSNSGRNGTWNNTSSNESNENSTYGMNNHLTGFSGRRGSSTGSSNNSEGSWGNTRTSELTSGFNSVLDRTSGSNKTADMTSGTTRNLGTETISTVYDPNNIPGTTKSTKDYTWLDGAGWVKGTTDDSKARTGKNGLINAMDGTTYQSGMRYLSTSGNPVAKNDLSVNDKFMRMNMFLGNADLSMILHMLSQRSDTDLLSAPKVVTKSGQEATMKVVTIYRYPQDYDVTIQSTSSSGGGGYYSSGGSSGKILPMVEPQNFETQEVGVILTVTPDLSPEGLINLQLQPRIISEPEWRDYGMKVPMDAVMGDSNMIVNGLDAVANIASSQKKSAEDIQWFSVPMEQPFFKERSIDTHVTLYNGSTIVMGGLITEERRSMEDKIPFLGDIPFIGRIFRSRSEWSNKRNLLIFVTARLVDPNGRQILQNVGDKEANKEGEAKVTPAPAAN